MGVSKNRGTPKLMVKIMENPINPWMIWGENPPFKETPKCSKQPKKLETKTKQRHLEFRGLSLYCFILDGTGFPQGATATKVEPTDPLLSHGPKGSIVMVYLPRCQRCPIKNHQMLVNTPYVDLMGSADCLV